MLSTRAGSSARCWRRWRSSSASSASHCCPGTVPGDDDRPALPALWPRPFLRFISQGVSSMSLTEARKQYKPFEYPWAYDFWKRKQQIHWMPEEVPLGEDCRHWAQKLTDHERNLLTQLSRFFPQDDNGGTDCCLVKYGREFQPTEPHKNAKK